MVEPADLSSLNKRDEHDDVIKWTHFPRYWPCVWGIHRSPVNSPHKGQWRGALMFTLIYARINGWVKNREAGDLRRYRAHCDVIVLEWNPLTCHPCILWVAVWRWTAESAGLWRWPHGPMDWHPRWQTNAHNCTWTRVWKEQASPTVVIGSNIWGIECCHIINTLRPRQNGRRFADDVFKWIFLI